MRRGVGVAKRFWLMALWNGAAKGYFKIGEVAFGKAPIEWASSVAR